MNITLSPDEDETLSIAYNKDGSLTITLTSSVGHQDEETPVLAKETEESYLRLNQVVAETKSSYYTLTKLLNQGLIPGAAKIGTRWRIPKASLPELNKTIQGLQSREPNVGEGFLTVAKLAKEAGVSVVTIRSLIKRGKLREAGRVTVKGVDVIRISEEEAQKVLQNKPLTLRSPLGD